MVSLPESAADGADIMNAPESVADGANVINVPESVADGANVINVHKLVADGANVINVPESVVDGANVINVPESVADGVNVIMVPESVRSWRVKRDESGRGNSGVSKAPLPVSGLGDVRASLWMVPARETAHRRAPAKGAAIVCGSLCSGGV